MESINISPHLDIYSAPKKSLWTGRESPSQLGVQYWYQQVELYDLNIKNKNHKKNDIVLLGYSCEEGVKRNKGRIGAIQGPDAIRAYLAPLSYHHHSKRIIDYGNLTCTAGDLNTCQEALSEFVAQTIRLGGFPIILGGGHDVAYGHFVGIHKALVFKKSNKIGIINFDAHFDLRPVDSKPNSGTPFNQILTEYGETTSYLAIGIQQASNTKELFKIAQEKKVHYLLSEACELSNFELIKAELDTFINQNDVVYLTIDLDGFSSAYAPGVSAPSPLGFSPHFFLKALAYLMKSQKVIAVDIAELNPNYDRDHCTARLAARIVDAIVGGAV